MKKLLLSLTKKDFEVQTFRAGGKGGQHQNVTDSAVRIIHEASGATGECREHRHQVQNKKEAFKRLTSSFKFKHWLSKRIQEIEENVTIEEKVEQAMSPENILIEIKEGGKWKKFVNTIKEDGIWENAE
jgi:protein subunit release factor B